MGYEAEGYIYALPIRFQLIFPALLYTDKKENQIFLIYKEIQSGAVAKSYMSKGFLIWGNEQTFPNIWGGR